MVPVPTKPSCIGALLLTRQPTSVSASPPDHTFWHYHTDMAGADVSGHASRGWDGGQQRGATTVLARIGSANGDGSSVPVLDRSRSCSTPSIGISRNRIHCWRYWTWR